MENIILTIVLSYLIGSIPFGLIITKLSGGQDIRSQGSGNIGATNVARVAGKKLGALTLLLDGAKGAVAILLAQEEYMQIAAISAVIGHILPIWLRFKGGKGVATSLGVILALNPILGAAFAISWLLVFFISKISSISAMIAIFVTTIISAFFMQEYLFLTISLLIIIIIKHISNIRRLISGDEIQFK